MTKASITATENNTIRPNEAAHFGALASDWWDPKGASAMLHKLNPVRLEFIRGALDAHWGGDPAARYPLKGKTVLDVGCGAGLLCEPMTRLGGAVTGVDAAPENIEAARVHAVGSALDIDYRSGEIGSQDIGTFDVVSSMEVIEHVADPAIFLAQLVSRLAPGGLMLLSTPNRTAQSRLLLVEAAERFGQIPRGTHNWDQFLTPGELEALLTDAGMRVTAMRGIAFSPSKGLHVSDNTALNYILSAVRI
jgi:2-polyprenyl-6-hydroxyphenyl methylase / 3-demethylubiquinone-9 3-methyltransferase